jgi:hypothetical protein
MMQVNRDSDLHTQRIAQPFEICHEPFTHLNLDNDRALVCCGAHPPLPYASDYITKPTTEPASFENITGYRNVSELFNSDAHRRLREELLTGKPATYCEGCMLHANTAHQLDFGAVFNRYWMQPARLKEARRIFIERFRETPYLERMLPDWRKFSDSGLPIATPPLTP